MVFRWQPSGECLHSNKNFTLFMHVVLFGFIASLLNTVNVHAQVSHDSFFTTSLKTIKRLFTLDMTVAKMFPIHQVPHSGTFALHRDPSARLHVLNFVCMV